VERVYLSPGCAFAWSQKTVRAGQGAHFHVDIFEHADLEAIAREFPGRVIATDPHASVSLFDTNLRGACALLIGNEGGGLSPVLAQAAQERIAIPMPGGFESLNAALAAAVCLFEKVRQDATAQPAA
jgi:TrmH family RNA methyltransferase